MFKNRKYFVRDAFENVLQNAIWSKTFIKFQIG